MFYCWRRGTKWLLLSTRDPALSAVCNPAASDGLLVLSAAYCRRPAGLQQQRQPTAITEVVTSSEQHLHSLLTSVEVDHLLCLEPEAAAVADMLAVPGTPPCGDSLASTAVDTPDAADHAAPAAEGQAVEAQSVATEEAQWQQVAHLASMCWAYRARHLARLRCKASLISRGHKPVPGWPIMFASSGSSSSGDGGGGTSAAVAAAALGSLAQGASKTLFMEDREACGTSLDLPVDGSSPHLSASQLVWLLQSSGESCCALRGSQLFAERLVRQPSLPRQRLPSLSCQPGMACVVSGGTRGLGLQVAQQLVAKGCRTLVLTSRSGLLSRQQLADLAAQGELKYWPCGMAQEILQPACLQPPPSPVC